MHDRSVSLLDSSYLDKSILTNHLRHTGANLSSVVPSSKTSSTHRMFVSHLEDHRNHSDRSFYARQIYLCYKHFRHAGMNVLQLLTQLLPYTSPELNTVFTTAQTSWCSDSAVWKVLSMTFSWCTNTVHQSSSAHFCWTCELVQDPRKESGWPVEVAMKVALAETTCCQ